MIWSPIWRIIWTEVRIPKKMLTRLERRLEQQSREMKPSEEYRQLSAARQAVQAAALAMQLYHAGHKDDSH
jgi:chromosome segregation ATPase